MRGKGSPTWQNQIRNPENGFPRGFYRLKGEMRLKLEKKLVSG